MLKTEVGTRVIAIQSANDMVVRFYGEGIYAGDFPLPPEAAGFNFGQNNPRIDLDNSKTVWGCESWWGEAKAVRARYPEPEWQWVEVDLELGDDFEGAYDAIIQVARDAIGVGGVERLEVARLRGLKRRLYKEGVEGGLAV